MAPAERYAYDEHLNAIMIQNDVLSTAKLEGLTEGRSKGLAEGRAEGLAEGRAEGLAEGRAEGILSTARNLKAMGLSMEDISRATGLSKEDIEIVGMRSAVFEFPKYQEIFHALSL